jgi:hypothetical protein
MFSGVATICAFTDDTNIGLAICMAFLAFAAALEGFINFCLGCFMFKYMVHFGLVNKSVIERCNDTFDEQLIAMDYEDQRLNEGPQQSVVITFPGSKMFHSYKRKTDEQILEGFHLIKHCEITYFGAVMGLTGNAVVWYRPSPKNLN